MKPLLNIRGKTILWSYTLCMFVQKVTCETTNVEDFELMDGKNRSWRKTDVTIWVTSAQQTVLSHPFDSRKFDELIFNAHDVIISAVFADIIKIPTYSRKAYNFWTTYRRKMVKP